MRLTFLAALGFGALVVLAHGGVSVVNTFVVLRAVEARADLVATQRLRARSPLTLDFIGVVDQNIPVGTVVGVAVDFLRGLRKLAIGDGLRQPSVLTVVFQVGITVWSAIDCMGPLVQYNNHAGREMEF